MVSLFTLYNTTNIWFKVSAKPSDKNMPNIYQIFHIYQIKNLCTEHFENTQIFQIWFVYIYTTWWNCTRWATPRKCSLSEW